MNKNNQSDMIDFGIPEDSTESIIKVIGVGGGGCNAVKNMYEEGITGVTFAITNTDKQALQNSPVPVKILLGEGLGAGGDPARGEAEAKDNIEDIKNLLSDGTRMVFITAGMGGGTGTGAAPVVAGVAKSMGLLTIGVVTIPFYFERKKKIIKALKGIEELRKNVDAILIVNNERLCDVYSYSKMPVKEAFQRANDILKNATKSISELITVNGDINLDFRDVEATMRRGGGAIMAIGRASGEHRVQDAILDALNSPLLYGSDISKAKKILFNIYTGSEGPLFVDEMNQIDAFMETLDPNIEVIWGINDDDTIGADAKVTILATGLDNEYSNEMSTPESTKEEYDYDAIIKKLYRPFIPEQTKAETDEVPLIIEPTTIEEPAVEESTIEPASNEVDPPSSEQLTEQPVTSAGVNKHLTFVERLKIKMAEMATRIYGDEE